MVAAAAAWISTILLAGERKTLGIVFVMLAMAYNPFFPIHLGRDTWEVINVATIVALLVGFALRPSLQVSPDPPG